jgi:cellobiose-specific phosphotransferase system component IIA
VTADDLREEIVTAIFDLRDALEDAIDDQREADFDANQAKLRDATKNIEDATDATV